MRGSLGLGLTLVNVARQSKEAGTPTPWAWPQDPQGNDALAVADALNRKYGVGGTTELAATDVFADSSYGGTDDTQNVTFDPDLDIGSGGLIIAGYGPRRIRIQLAGDVLAAAIQDEKSIVLEFEDLEGCLGKRFGLLQFAQNNNDDYAIEVDFSFNEIYNGNTNPSYSSGASIYDYDVFSPTPVSVDFNANGVNKIGVTFSGGQCYCSINGVASGSGSLDRSAEPDIAIVLLGGNYCGMNIAVRSLTVYDAVSNSDLDTLTTVSSPTGRLQLAASSYYDYRYIEVFNAVAQQDWAKSSRTDMTDPGNAVYYIPSDSSTVDDWFAGEGDPFLWATTTYFGDVNGRPLPQASVVAGSGWFVPEDLSDPSKLLALDAEIWVTLPQGYPLTYIIEYLETAGDVTRKGGLLTKFVTNGNTGTLDEFNNPITQYRTGWVQVYFEGGHIKVGFYIVIPTYSAETGPGSDPELVQVVVGPAVSPETVTRVAMLWQPETGDFGISVNGGAATTASLTPLPNFQVTEGRPIGFLSVPSDGSYNPGYMPHTVSDPLIGWIREVTVLDNSWSISDLHTLSALP